MEAGFQQWACLADATEAEHQVWVLAQLAMGRTPTSLHLDKSSAGELRYTSVWVNAPGPALPSGFYRFLPALPWSSMKGRLAIQRDMGRYPRYVGAAEVDGELLVTVITSPGPLSRLDPFGRPTEAYNPSNPDSGSYLDVSSHSKYIGWWYPSWAAVYTEDAVPLGEYVIHGSSSGPGGLTPQTTSPGIGVPPPPPPEPTLTVAGSPVGTRAAIIWTVQPSYTRYRWQVYVTRSTTGAEYLGQLRRGFSLPHVLSPMVTYRNDSPGVALPPSYLMIQRGEHLHRFAHFLDVPSQALSSVLFNLDTADLWPICLQGAGDPPYRQFSLVVMQRGELGERPRQLQVERVGTIHFPAPPKQAQQGFSAASDAGTSNRASVQPVAARFEGSSGASSTGFMAEKTSTEGPLGNQPNTPHPVEAEAKGTLGFQKAGEDPTLTQTMGHPAAIESGPTFPNDPFLKAQQWMIQFMRRKGVHAGQLAIVKAGKLKYAAAFTLAPAEWGTFAFEPGWSSYPKTRLSTRFRIGSLSKTVTAIGVMKLSQDQGFNIFTTPLGLALDIPTSNPWRARWDQRVIAHVLCHTAYFKHENVIYGDDNLVAWLNPNRVAAALGGSVTQASLESHSFTRGQFAEYLRSLDANLFMFEVPPPEVVPPLAPPPVDYRLRNEDGVAPAAIYSNFGYNRLGDMLEAQLSNPDGYVGWIQLNLLGGVDPGAARASTFQAPSPGSKPSEALYHPERPKVGPNQYDWTVQEGALKLTGRYAPLQYEASNWELGAASGGWAMPATTLARLLGRLRTSSSPLNAVNERRLLDRPFASNGYTLGMARRFQVPLPKPATTNQWVAYNNGYWEGTVAGLWVRDDGVAVVVCFNREFPGGWSATATRDLDAAINDHHPDTWGDYDYFGAVP